MLVSPVGGNKQGMTLLIVQDHQSTTAQDFPRASDQPTWEQRISIDGLAVSIDIEDWNWVLSPLCVILPQRSGPACKRFCQGSIGSNRSQFGQKSLDVAVAVSPIAASEQC